MRKRTIATLPPIAVEERPEKLALQLSQGLKRTLESFSEYFTSTTGTTPTSLNAVIVGILTGYIEQHAGYQRWLKASSRNDPSDGGTSS